MTWLFSYKPRHHFEPEHPGLAGLFPLGRGFSVTNQLHPCCDFANLLHNVSQILHPQMLRNNQQSISSQLSEVSRSAPPATSVLEELCLHSVFLSQPFLLHLNLLPDSLYLEAVEPLQVPWIHPPVSSKSSSAPGSRDVDLTAGAD